MIKRNQILALLEEHKAEMKKLGIRRIGIFGSYAKQTQRKNSDVDILVEFSPGQKTFDNYMDLKVLLEKILKKKVDLVTKTALKPRIKSSILRETQYAGL